MNFDFYQLYKDYSNTELLKIVKQPTEYQPEAVVVATQILNNRKVTTEEIELIDQHFQNIDNIAKIKKEKIDAFKEKANDFFEPILHPSEKVQPNKWVNILLFIIVLQYVWSVFWTVRRLIDFLQCDYCSLDITFISEFLTLLYVPFIFFLLFKRRRWGWILLFADTLFSLILRVSQSYIFFKFQSIHHGNTNLFFLGILINIVILYFLWSDKIANQFRIIPSTKKKTTIITTAVTLLFIFIIYGIARL